MNICSVFRRYPLCIALPLEKIAKGMDFWWTRRVPAFIDSWKSNSSYLYFGQEGHSQMLCHQSSDAERIDKGRYMLVVGWTAELLKVWTTCPWATLWVMSRWTWSNWVWPNGWLLPKDLQPTHVGITVFQPTSYVMLAEAVTSHAEHIHSWRTSVGGSI